MRSHPSPTPVHARGARGFTVIEILVALAIFAIGAMSLMALVPAGTRSNAEAWNQTRASELGAACAERLLATPYGDAELTAGAHQDSPWPHPGGYYVRWTVENDQPIPLCKRITVTVRWPNAASPPLAQLVAVKPQANDEAP